MCRLMAGRAFFKTSCCHTFIYAYGKTTYIVRIFVNPECDSSGEYLTTCMRSITSSKMPHLICNTRYVIYLRSRMFPLTVSHADYSCMFIISRDIDNLQLTPSQIQIYVTLGRFTSHVYINFAGFPVYSLTSSLHSSVVK